MSRNSRGVMIASTLLLAAILIAGCRQPYSTPPAATNTPIDPNSFFSTPIPSQPANMQDVENITTQTAMATVMTSTPGVGTTTTPAPATGATATATPIINLPITATATQAVVAVQTSTPVPAGSRPATYVLKPGEFPYCIARRFNVDPDELLRLSGLSAAQADSLTAGTVLTIPQSGAFPGDRSWHDHPATFTVGVTYNTNTVYGVACYYGDIEPSVIAQNNGISVDATLSAGQTLNIP